MNPLINSLEEFLASQHLHLTIERITTHGKLRALMMARANDVLPEPELPATPIMLVLAHGGE